MKDDSSSLNYQLLALLQAVRDTQDATAHSELNDLLRRNPAARHAMSRLLVDEQALIHRLRDDSIVSLLDSAPSAKPAQSLRAPHWYAWRPLTAAAAGIVFGLICTSVVYGFVAQRAAVKKIPLSVFDPGFEGMKPLDKGLPHNLGEWGVRSARIVPAEEGVLPLQGGHMLRMEPGLLSELDKNLYSHAFQVLDLRSLPLDAVSGATEVQVTASFCVPGSAAKVRHVIQVVALNDSPAKATEDLWSKTKDEGVVSLRQRFETRAGDSNWHTFSVKMPLPHGAQSMIIILSAISPKDQTTPAAVRYLDDVQVSLLTLPNSINP